MSLAFKLLELGKDENLNGFSQIFTEPNGTLITRTVFESDFKIFHSIQNYSKTHFYLINRIKISH